MIATLSDFSTKSDLLRGLIHHTIFVTCVKNSGVSKNIKVMATAK